MNKAIITILGLFLRLYKVAFHPESSLPRRVSKSLRINQSPTLYKTSINSYEAPDHSHFSGARKLCLLLSSTLWIPSEHPVYANHNSLACACKEYLIIPIILEGLPSHN
jgi:hypothetical protein